MCHSFTAAVHTSRLITRMLLLGITLLTVAGSACSGGQPLLLRLVEARRLASDLHISFTKASEASSRAVLADTDDVSAAAAKEATDATAAAARTLGELESALTSLGYGAETDLLHAFRGRFDEFQTLDSEILALAVENTNLKAQRLSFGAGRELGEQVTAELQRFAAGGGPGVEAQVQALRADVYELLFLEARHNAEAEDAAMTALEGRSAELVSDARRRFARLKGTGSQATLDAALSFFDRLMAVHAEVIVLSRRNTNVRSLALTLGRQRVVAAECEVQLVSLQRALARHGSEATR